jgi:hypothetical protein
MEHLMSARERRERQDEIRHVPSVPWLGFDHDRQQYPLTTIKEYPCVRGWTIHEVQQLEFGDLGDRSPTEALAMIQSWMFLGLLESAFNSRFKTKDFVTTTTNGSSVVHTDFIRKWIDDFHVSSNLQPSSNLLQRRAQQGRLVDTLKYASFWNQRLVEIQGEGRALSAILERFGSVTRLITLVAEAVWTVAQQFPSTDQRFFIDCDWSISPGNDRDLRTRLERRGWCPSLYSKVVALSRTPSSFLEYVGVVPPMDDTPNQHQKCSPDECVEYNVDETNYHTLHRTKGCQCKPISPPPEDVKKSLLEWTVPIIDGNSLLNLDFKKSVRIYSPDRPLQFVAFSHVWSDGLGSCTEDGIPRCQVQYLLDTAIHAADTPMFWIDSLCIPRDNATRKLAISMMAEIYKSAHTTVVLDSRIKRCNADLSLETKIVALSLSTWQERLWTLQESSLSKHVTFAFENALVSAETIIENSGQKIHRPIVRTAHLLLDNLTNWVHNNQVTVGGLQRNLYRRTSSKPDDESLAVAPFLNIDISPLLEVGGEERMMRFWNQARHVPKAIILHNLPKITRDGFRWAPKSIMNQKNALLLDLQDRSATVTEDGLRGEYWMYELQMPSPTTLQMDIYLCDTQSECCLRLLEHDSAPNLSISENHAVVFVDQPVPSMQTYVGVVLSRTSAGQGAQQQRTPTYRYEGLVGANLISKSELIRMVGTELAWSHVAASAKGQITGKRAEIVIR